MRREEVIENYSTLVWGIRGPYILLRDPCIVLKPRSVRKAICLAEDFHSSLRD